MTEWMMVEKREFSREMPKVELTVYVTVALMVVMMAV